MICKIFMDRRKALKHIGLLSGGMVLLPSCDLSKENVSRVMNKLKVTESQEALLAELVDTIIPESEIPGAKSLKVADFVWVMVDDCLDESIQEPFLSGLDQFKSRFREINGTGFDNASQDDRAMGLKTLLNQPSSTDPDDPVAAMIEIAKSFTILGFNKSEYIMTEVMPYTLIPGKNPECRNLDPNEKINTNA